MCQLGITITEGSRSKREMIKRISKAKRVFHWKKSLLTSSKESFTYPNIYVDVELDRLSQRGIKTGSLWNAMLPNNVENLVVSLKISTKYNVFHYLINKYTKFYIQVLYLHNKFCQIWVHRIHLYCTHIMEIFITLYK